jgi:uncharacterized protein YcfL
MKGVTMKKVLLILVLLSVVIAGCGGPKTTDPRVNTRRIGNDSLGDNIITRPFQYAISALMGEGVEIIDVREGRTPEGFLDVQMIGYNSAYGVKQFEYRTEWMDANGMIIPTQTSVWKPVSAMGKSEVTFRFIAPRREAVDFRLNTRKRKN